MAPNLSPRSGRSDRYGGHRSGHEQVGGKLGRLRPGARIETGADRASHRPEVPSGARSHPDSLSAPSAGANRAALHRLVQEHTARFRSRTETSTCVCTKLPRFINDKLNAARHFAHGVLRIRKCDHDKAIALQSPAPLVLPFVRRAAHVSDHGAAGLPPKAKLAVELMCAPTAGCTHRQSGGWYRRRRRGPTLRDKGTGRQLPIPQQQRGQAPRLRSTVAVRRPRVTCACGSPPEPQTLGQPAQRSQVPARRPTEGCRLRQHHPRCN